MALKQPDWSVDHKRMNSPTPGTGGPSDTRRLPAAANTEEVYRHLLESAPDAIVGVGQEGRIVLVNSATERLFGYARDELIGEPVETLVPERYQGAHTSHRGGYFAHPGTRSMGAGLDLYGLRRDGTEFAAEISLSSIDTADGVLATAVVRDVTERKRMESALREAEERFRGTFEGSGIGMAVVASAAGGGGRLLEVNDALCTLTGHAREHLLRMKFESLVHPDDLPEAEEGIRRLANGELKVFHHELCCIHASGDQIWVDLTSTLVRGPDGEPMYRIDQLQDATERKRFEGQLQYLADHDPLTGLFNRRRFFEELDRELAIAQRYGNEGALLSLDLDHFKYVNDSLGHARGDELLTRVAGICRERLRDTDLLARLGGDEFAIILPRSEEQQARDFAESLVTAVRKEIQLEIGLRARRVTVSIGIAPFGDGDGLTAVELLNEADIAMYDAKEAGRDTISTYDTAEHRQTKMQARLSWADRIRDALKNDAFVLHAQPILALNGDQRPRQELRLLGEDGDLIPPGVFLYIAERFGLAPDLDRWVVRHAIDLLAEHQQAGSDLCLQVNLSAHSVTDNHLIELVTDRLAATRADPRGLCFELTETAAIINVDRARDFARELSSLGCEFALDDFGAGFASFYYLKHLQFDYLKIDGEFIKDLPSSHTNQVIVKSVVQMAQGLGKKTIAEFVEDEPTLDLLRDYGVDYAQGYHIAKPAPLEPIALGKTPAGIATRP